MLVGDHRQLPPTIKAKAAERGGLATLFERLLDAGSSCTVLDTQYRMHPATQMPAGSSMRGGYVTGPRAPPVASAARRLEHVACRVGLEPGGATVTAACARGEGGRPCRAHVNPYPNPNPNPDPNLT